MRNNTKELGKSMTNENGGSQQTRVTKLRNLEMECDVWKLDVTMDVNLETERSKEARWVVKI